jgi:hypothetical protein
MILTAVWCTDKSEFRNDGCRQRAQISFHKSYVRRNSCFNTVGSPSFRLRKPNNKNLAGDWRSAPSQAYPFMPNYGKTTHNEIPLQDPIKVPSFRTNISSKFVPIGQKVPINVLIPVPGYQGRCPISTIEDFNEFPQNMFNSHFVNRSLWQISIVSDLRLRELRLWNCAVKRFELLQ